MIFHIRQSIQGFTKGFNSAAGQSSNIIILCEQSVQLFLIGSCKTLIFIVDLELDARCAGKL
jgi:hypothetical protein